MSGAQFIAFDKMDKFENIKIGDTITYNAGGWYGVAVLSKVTRVTNKQFEDERGEKFRKSDGKMIGTAYRFCRIATNEDIQSIREAEKRSKLIKKIRYFEAYSNVEKLSTNDLEAIVEIINKYEKQ